MIELSREHLGIMMEAGYIYIGMRRFKEARALFEGLIVLAPESDVPLVALGNVDFCEGKIPKAVKNYNQALKIDPTSLFAKIYLGEALLFDGKRDEAMSLIKEVASADKGGAGEFARALLDAVKAGFDPKKDAPVTGLKVVK
jgi:predicted Zn-dependent protease